MLSTASSIISDFSNLIVSLTGLGVAVLAIIRPLRNWIVRRMTSQLDSAKKLDDIISDLKTVKKNQERDSKEQELIRDALLATIRNDLTALYYRAVDDNGISDYNRENFEKLYAVYKELGGNSYIHEIYTLVVKMPRLKTKTVRKKKTKKV